MNRLKKIFTSLLIGAFFLGVSHSPVLAVEPWDVTGNYDIGFQLTGDPTVYTHDANLIQTGSAVSGSGGYPAVGFQTYSWLITSGNVSGNAITLTMDYTLGAIGTTMNMTGTIAPDGSMSGTWSDNYGGPRDGTWATSAGNAELTIPEQCNQAISYNLINGTNKSEVINGTDGNDLIYGYDGADVISGKTGNDCIVGGNGADTIKGNNGDDVILGGNGADTILGENDNDKIYGDSGADTLRGGNGDDVLDGGLNTDVARGDNGIDTCIAESKNSCEL